MIEFALCLGGVLAVVVVAEVLWRLKILEGEYNRKFVHIIVGSFAAAWPWILNWKQVHLLSIILLLGVLINRAHVLMHYNFGIKRRTYGDFFFPIGILLASIITTNRVFFAIAVLNMAVADGLAAIIGLRFGERWRYKVFGYTKTVMGTMTFWFSALLIIGIGLLYARTDLAFGSYALAVLLLPPALSAFENFSLFGMDDVTVPVVTLLALQLLQS